MKRKKELRCCLGCGRDTTSDYCLRCVCHAATARSQFSASKSSDMPLEDDYSEESNADSVCEDNSVCVSRIH